VRARDRKSLEYFASKGVAVQRSPEGDYPYRAFVDHSIMAPWFLDMGGLATKYSNFKSRVRDTHPRMEPLLHEVWAVMTQLEDDEARNELTDQEKQDRNNFNSGVE
jgi:hypothetical protein